MPQIAFADFTPDSPDLGEKACDASGVIAEEKGYRPFKTLATTSNALTARAQGAAWFRKPNGNTINFAGDATKLYSLSSITWSDATRVSATTKAITGLTQANPAVVTSVAHGYSNGDTVYISGVGGMTQVNGNRYVVANVAANTFELSGTNSTGYGAYTAGGTAQKVLFYTTDGTANWRFALFGAKTYATNNTDNLQSYDLNSGSMWADASGSPPVGKFIGVVRRFLVLANIASYPQRVNWSGDNNSDTWASSATTLADYQDLPDGGEISGFVGGEFGLVFQESAITRMTFEGSPTVFRFDKIANDLGATIPNSVVGWGNLAFFIHRSGIYMVKDGQQIVPIGKDRVDRWFWGMIDQGSLNRCTVAVDPVNSLYMLSFPTGSGGTPSTILIYNWKSDRWSYVPATCEMIYSGAVQQSWTLEDLDTFGTIEAVPFSLDSSYWTGSRQLLLAGFYTDHKWGTFSGANAAMSIDTQEFKPADGKRARILSARPLVDGGSPQVAVGTRNTQQQAVTWTMPRSTVGDGKVPLRADGRYVRFRISQSAGASWQWAWAIDDIDARPSGMR